MHKDFKAIPYSFTSLPDDDMIMQARAFYQRIKTRRSVRDFSAKAVPKQVIEQAILAAGTAPNGANMQPWYFVAVSNGAIKRQIRLAAEKEEREFYEQRASQEWLDALSHLGTDAQKPFLEIASHLIVVFLKKFSYDEHGTKLKNYYTSESVGLATGFLIDALHHSGVATLTHTPSPMKFLNEILERPSDERPFMILVAGYPADNCEVPVIDKKPLTDIATFLD